MDYNEARPILETLPEYGKVNAVFTRPDGTKETKRLARAKGGGFLVMFPRSSRKGLYIDHYFLSYFSSIEIKTQQPVPEEVKWRKSWEKALTYLSKSGLWTDMADDVRLALDVGYEKLTQAYREDWKDYPGLSWQEQYQARANAIAEIDPRLVGTDDAGKAFIKNSIVWYMSKPAKIKSMYFGKYEHKQKSQALKQAMEAKVAITVYGRSSYDVHCEYNPELNKAWYSEEYKNTGNGHYYLALDGVHALFYEDD